MKHKGFTLVELLGVISVLAVLALIVAVPVTKLIKDSNQKACQSQVDSIILAAKLWGKDNKEMLPKTVGEITNIFLDTLQKEGYLENPIKNPVTKSPFPNISSISIKKVASAYWQYTVLDAEEMCQKGSVVEKYPDEYVKNGLTIQYDGFTAPTIVGGKMIWKDLSGKGNNGTLSGFPLDINSFWKNNSLIFDGENDYISTKNPFFTKNGSTHPITIEIISEKDTRNPYAMVFSPTDCVNSYNYLSLWTTTESARSYAIYYSTKMFWNQLPITPYENQYMQFTQQEAPTTTPQSISYGVGTENYFTYLNSVRRYDAKKTYSLGFHSDTFYIGRAHTASDLAGKPISSVYPLDGKIYSVRIYDRQLTEFEIKQNYLRDKKRFNL